MGWRILWNLSAALFAFLAIAACAEMNNQPAKPITKIEARTLPAAAVTELSTDQLADILLLAPPVPNRGRPHLVLSDLWYMTKPRPTAHANLCQSDQVVFAFASTDADTSTVDANTPTRVVGIRSTPHFRLVGPPVADNDDGLSAEIYARLQEACAGIDPHTTAMFSAEDADDANEGMALVGTVLDGAKNAKPPFDLTCRDHTVPCANLFSDVTLQNVSSISNCRDLAEEGRCWFVEAPGVWFEIRTRFIGEKRVITHVRITEVVTLAHSRPD